MKENTQVKIIVSQERKAQTDSIEQYNRIKKIIANTRKNEQISFESAMRNYENAVHTGQDTTEALAVLAEMCARSVIKKCSDPHAKGKHTEKIHSMDGNEPVYLTDNCGQNDVMLQLKREIRTDKNALLSMRKANLAPVQIKYSENGDIYTEYDKAAQEAIARLAHERLGDGIDLVHTAIVQVLAETQKPDFDTLETPYTVQKLSKQVRIKSDTSAAWKEVETKPIVETYRAVRTQVAENRQTDSRNKYLYLDAIVTDENGNEYREYHRLPLYADLGGYACDMNGQTFYTADDNTAETTEQLIEQLNLTTQQATILNYRLKGYGLKAIATALGVKKNTVIVHLKRTGEKIKKHGLTVTPQLKRVLEYDKELSDELTDSEKEECKSLVSLLDNLRVAYSTQTVTVKRTLPDGTKKTVKHGLYTPKQAPQSLTSVSVPDGLTQATGRQHANHTGHSDTAEDRRKAVERLTTLDSAKVDSLRKIWTATKPDYVTCKTICNDGGRVINIGTVKRQTQATETAVQAVQTATQADTQIIAVVPVYAVKKDGTRIKIGEHIVKA